MSADNYRALAIVEPNSPEPIAPSFEDRKGNCPACGERTKTWSFARGPHRYGFLWLRRCSVSVPHVHQRCRESGALTFDGGCGCTWTAAVTPELAK